MEEIPLPAGPLLYKTGFNERQSFIAAELDAEGTINIFIREDERITLDLGPAVLSGYMRVGDSLWPLPLGSTFDRLDGKFYWQPGPGFIGTYEFVFFYGHGTQGKKKNKIFIRILPKFRLLK